MSEITLKQFNGFLDAKAPEKPCPECSTNHWGTPNSPNSPPGDDGVLFRPSIAPDLLRFGIPVYPLICHNCGFIKFFSAAIVEDWTQSNG